MSTNVESPAPSAGVEAPRRSRARWVLAAAVAAVVVGAVALSLSTGGDDDGDAVASPALELSLGAEDATASCLAVDAATLSMMPMAFAATATEVDGELVTLDVDRWYTGGDAQVVQLRATSGQAALIAGFDLAVGERYLISASEGAVSFCGFSGPATPELSAVFDEAFPS